MKWWWVVGIMWGSGEVVVVVVTSLLQAAVRGPARLQHCSTAAAGDPRPIFSQGSINCAAASCRSCCSCWPQLGPFTRPPPPHHLTYLVPGNHNTTAASPVEALNRGHVHPLIHCCCHASGPQLLVTYCLLSLWHDEERIPQHKN